MFLPFRLSLPTLFLGVVLLSLMLMGYVILHYHQHYQHSIRQKSDRSILDSAGFVMSRSVKKDNGLSLFSPNVVLEEEDAIPTFGNPHSALNDGELQKQEATKKEKDGIIPLRDISISVPKFQASEMNDKTITVSHGASSMHERGKPEFVHAASHGGEQTRSVPPRGEKLDVHDHRSVSMINAVSVPDSQERETGDYIRSPEQQKEVAALTISDTKPHLGNFSVPWADGYSVDYFHGSTWFQSLLKFTRSFDHSEPIVTVCADTAFIDGLLNWLVSTVVLLKQPLKNILVVTNRAKVCSLLESHKLPTKCLKLSADSVLSGEGMNRVKGHQFSQLLVVRMSVMRILNRLGYDVLNLDTDAIVLKNPISVLESNRDSDVVGTFGGQLPKWLFKKWGLVVCMGTVMVRSTPATGEAGQQRVGNKVQSIGRGSIQRERKSPVVKFPTPIYGY